MHVYLKYFLKFINSSSAANAADIETDFKKLEYHGSAIIQNVFTKTEIDKIKSIIHAYFNKHESAKANQQLYAIRELLIELPELKELLINSNIQKILSKSGEALFCQKHFTLTSLLNPTGMLPGTRIPRSM